jgi:hypothetical protein
MRMVLPFQKTFLRGVFLTAIAAAAIAIACFARADSGPPASSSSPEQRQPVLVELFTSEGCSDCPPADALLAKLDQQQFISGAEAIVLSEHVTYWNHLGWSDPFSFASIDARQQNYAQHFGLDSVYTPQMVVDGAAQFVGSDSAKLKQAVARAATAPKPALAISNAQRAPDGTVVFQVRAATGAEATLVAALAENATRSEVARGENAGRTLHHVAVVRVLKNFGSGAADGRQLQLPGAGNIAQEKDGEPLRLVVFLVSPSSGHVLAVAQQTLGR